MATKIIIWDFDGTLVLHDGLWSGAMIAALDELIKDHKIIIDDIKPYLSTGFPWHKAEIAHPELSSQGAWWDYIEKYLKTIFEKVGFDGRTSCILAKKTHEIYVDEKRYKIFPNTIETLRKLKNKGWKNVILSNHVPELPDIVNKLGFSIAIEKCFTSALIGYEKPNIKAFKYVLDYLQYPETCIMVGDSVKADVEGANKAGINAILLHTVPPIKSFNYCKTVIEVEETLVSLACS
jgi:putative hydrolase of the HAD superfamily